MAAMNQVEAVSCTMQARSRAGAPTSSTARPARASVKSNQTYQLGHGCDVAYIIVERQPAGIAGGVARELSSWDRNTKASRSRAMNSQGIEGSRHVLGKRSRQVQLALGDGMTKPQPMGVECLAVDQRDVGQFRSSGASPFKAG